MRTYMSINSFICGFLSVICNSHTKFRRSVKTKIYRINQEFFTCLFTVYGGAFAASASFEIAPDFIRAILAHTGPISS